MQKPRGFTLIEALVVLAVTAVLVMLAAPSFKRMVQSNAMSGAVNTFLADLRFARSEAIRLGGNVVMCRSDDPESASPACSTGAAPDNRGWVSGWVIFHDRNADSGWDAGEPVLRVQQRLTLDTILEGTPTASTVYHFTATGRLLAAGTSATVHFGGTNYETAVQRVVCVGPSGRARIAGDGSQAC